MKDCIFCKIVNRKIPAEILFENEWIIAFKDIKPIAPVHILIIPKKHLESVNQLTDDQESEKIGGHLLLAAKKLAQKEGIDKSGYKLLIRTGKDGGQEISHIHLHLLGGARLSEGIHPIY